MLLLLDRRGDARKRLLKVDRLHSVRLVHARRWKRSVWRHRYVRSWHNPVALATGQPVRLLG